MVCERHHLARQPLHQLTLKSAGFAATEGLKLLLGRREEAARGLFMTDVWTRESRRVTIPRDPDCPTCAGRYEFLETSGLGGHAELCGQDAIALRAPGGAAIDPAVTPVAPEEAVIEALKTVHDPEIPVNIYELGLIYTLEIAPDGNVRIDMTLTAPACPVAGEMPQWVADAVADVAGVGEVEVTMVWDPPWSPARMSDDAKMILDMG